MPKVQLWGYRCERCGHEWLPRGSEEPRVCPKCKSPYWNRPRKQQAPEQEGLTVNKRAERPRKNKDEARAEKD